MPEAVKDKIEEAAKGAPPEAAATEKKSGGLMKLLIAFGIAQVVLAAAAFFIVKMVFVPKLATASSEKAEAKAAHNQEAKPSEIFLIENIIVNPAGTNGTRYLSTSIGLEIEKSELKVEHMKEMTPVIRDILIAIISSRTIEELSTTEGKDLIRKEILEKLATAIGPEEVSKVYFVDYVLQ